MDKRQVSLDESLDYDRGFVLWRTGALLLTWINFNPNMDK